MRAPVFVCEGRFEARFAADLPRYKGLWTKNVKYEYCHKSCSIIYLDSHFHCNSLRTQRNALR